MSFKIRRETKMLLEEKQKPERAKTPDKIRSHANDYANRSWEQYTLSELGWWVHLLVKRSQHRIDSRKRDKDIHDAANYLEMMRAHLDYLGKKTIKKQKPEPFWAGPGYRGEYQCSHGVGHGSHIHGCDGCCSRGDYPLKKSKLSGLCRHDEPLRIKNEGKK